MYARSQRSCDRVNARTNASAASRGTSLRPSSAKKKDSGKSPDSSRYCCRRRTVIQTQLVSSECKKTALCVQRLGVVSTICLQYEQTPRKVRGRIVSRVSGRKNVASSSIGSGRDHANTSTSNSLGRLLMVFDDIVGSDDHVPCALCMQLSKRARLNSARIACNICSPL